MVLSVGEGVEKHTLSNITGKSVNLCKISRGNFSSLKHHKILFLSDSSSILRTVSYSDNRANTASDCIQVLITALLIIVKKKKKKKFPSGGDKLYYSTFFQ